MLTNGSLLSYHFYTSWFGVSVVNSAIGSYLSKSKKVFDEKVTVE